MSTLTIDYLAFTVQECTTPEALKAFLSRYFDLSELGYGHLGYKGAFVDPLRSCSLLYDGHREGMGCHVRISGQGLRQMELDDKLNWQDWLHEVVASFDARFSRIDIAIDDREFTVPFESVREAVEENRCVRYGSSWRLIENHSSKGLGRTLYLGARQSACMMRCYEKGTELGEKVPWLRFETEFKAELAHEVVLSMIDKGPECLAPIVAARFKFIEGLGPSVNRSRARPIEWWASIVGTARLVVRVADLVQRSVQRSLEWVRRQWSVSAALLTHAMEGDMTWFYEAVEKGEQRMTKRHRKMLELFRQMQNSPQFAGGY